jgi:hypothetical protein
VVLLVITVVVVVVGSATKRPFWLTLCTCGVWHRAVCDTVHLRGVAPCSMWHCALAGCGTVQYVTLCTCGVWHRAVWRLLTDIRKVLLPPFPCPFRALVTTKETA